jgi:hypothetical protein
MTYSLVPWLFGITMIAALAYAFWQWRATRRAQIRHDHSAMPPPGSHPVGGGSGRQPVHAPGSASGQATVADDGRSEATDHSGKTRI